MPKAHHTRKLIAGACMVLTPGLLLVSAILQPELDTDEAAQLAAIADDLDRWFISQAFALGALAVGVPAVLGLMYMLRERRVALGHIGGGLAFVGILALTGAVAINLVAWQMAQPGADTVQMVALLERVHETGGIGIPIYLLSFALGAGLVVLAAGLAAARAVNQPWPSCCASPTPTGSTPPSSAASGRRPERGSHLQCPSTAMGATQGGVHRGQAQLVKNRVAAHASPATVRPRAA